MIYGSVDLSIGIDTNNLSFKIEIEDLDSDKKDLYLFKLGSSKDHALSLLFHRLIRKTLKQHIKNLKDDLKVA